MVIDTTRQNSCLKKLKETKKSKSKHWKIVVFRINVKIDGKRSIKSKKIEFWRIMEKQISNAQ